MKTALIKIENEPSLLKDSVSKAVINTDQSSYQAYLRQRNRLQSDQAKINACEEKIQCLVRELDELKELKDTFKTFIDNINKR